MRKFSDWITERFYEWERAQGHRQSYAAFARWLEITPPSLTQYMKGDFEPSPDTVHKIAIKYPEVYSILGFDSQFTPELRNAIQSGVNKAAEFGFSQNTPEARQFIIEALIQLGDSINSTARPADKITT